MSADGSTIVFTRLSLDPCCADVYAVDVDGGNLRRITEDGRSSDPSWSPDGTRIVYVNGTRNPAWLQIRRLDDQDVLWLPTLGGAQAPVWSPDGSRIAFSSRNGIYSMAPDGSEAVLVAAGGRAPVWFPASDRLAYEFEGSVYAIGLNDEVGTPLLPRSQGTTWTPPDWSPNGEWIALTRGGDDVYLLHVDDGTMVRVTLPDFLTRSGDAVFVPGP